MKRVTRAKCSIVAKLVVSVLLSVGFATAESNRVAGVFLAWSFVMFLWSCFSAGELDDRRKELEEADRDDADRELLLQASSDEEGELSMHRKGD